MPACKELSSYYTDQGLRYCSTQTCVNFASKRSNYCSKCATRRYRENNPVEYTLNKLRNNAKRRGIFFSLTLPWFRKFCKETGYIEGKGLNPDSLTIDRIDATLGYIPGNIQVMTLVDNARKGRYEVKRKYKTKEEWGTPF